ncbi:hypothetical protein M9Y10_000189 [Tritrichomonas musculus]|uniref:Surface antigen BspA-like n=1 Tax=Tritrichomonas musculus TaxID=1915356 RepID=A0ABR2L5C2_9EUKA
MDIRNPDASQFKIILDSKVFHIPSEFPTLRNIRQSIYNELIEKHRYKVKANVCEEVMQFFLDYWVYKKIPQFSLNNIIQFELVSIEFDHMKSFIQIYKKNATRLGELKNTNARFKKVLPIRSKKNEQEMISYRKIIHILLTCGKTLDIKLKYEIIKAIHENDTDLLYNLAAENIIIDGFSFIINEEEGTAVLFRIIDSRKEFLIPYSIQCADREFMVTEIFKNCFKEMELNESFQFPPNSELRIIGEGVFAYSSLKRILIPPSVRVIGKKAFFNCCDLKTIEFSEDSELEVIGKKAFQDTALEEVTIPASIEHIEKGAFIGCLSIKKFEFPMPSKLNVIENSTFSETSITDITFPSSVTRICEDAFYNCKNLQSVTFLDDSELKVIEKNAFQKSSIKSLTIPSSVEELMEGWCALTNKLTNITVIEKDVNNISFYNNEFLLGKSDKNKETFDVLIFARRDIEKALIPSFIKEIDKFCFDKCEKLKSVEFSENSQIRKIGSNIFYSDSLQSFTIPSSVAILENDCFVYTTNLTSIKIQSNNAFFSYLNNSFILGKSDPWNGEYDILIFARRDIKKAVIPSFIKQIGPNAFDGCKQLESVEFPPDSQLSEIKQKAFSNTSLKEISIPSGVVTIHSEAFEHNSELTSVTFSYQSALKVIGAYAFANTSIKSIMIPSSVTKLDEYCFYCCKKLENVDFYDDSQLETINANCFCQSHLTRIDVPKNVEVIKECTFYDCQFLRRVKFPRESKLKSIERNAFMMTYIEELQIPSSVEYFEASWCNIATIFNVKIIKSDVENIICFNDQFILGKSDLDSDLFDELIFAFRGIKMAVIPPFITTISPFAFSHCTSLQSVHFTNEANIKTIGELAFSYTLIQSFTFPSNVTVLDYRVFCCCRNLKSIEFAPDSHLRVIRDSAFYKSAIESIIIPPSVTTINDTAFACCKNLKIIEIDEKSDIRSIWSKAALFSSSTTMIPKSFKNNLPIRFEEK